MQKSKDIIKFFPLINFVDLKQYYNIQTSKFVSFFINCGVFASIVYCMYYTTNSPTNFISIIGRFCYFCAYDKSKRPRITIMD
jgi:hypothetical protein